METSRLSITPWTELRIGCWAHWQPSGPRKQPATRLTLPPQSPQASPSSEAKLFLAFCDEKHPHMCRYIIAIWRTGVLHIWNAENYNCLLRTMYNIRWKLRAWHQSTAQGKQGGVGTGVRQEYVFLKVWLNPNMTPNYLVPWLFFFFLNNCLATIYRVTEQILMGKKWLRMNS